MNYIDRIKLLFVLKELFKVKKKLALNFNKSIFYSILLLDIIFKCNGNILKLSL